ncbi:hypothetical protein GCM10009677_10430 [Sphaerisporangium rubeum]|uniref:DUF397 domain-containing protein n=1 Tax=Sphaerisporangium rubeum TaxID=321317 RepID=UPI00160D3895|nr:DUF397 domain-containing protein [Sphaerisporangium rubeum]
MAYDLWVARWHKSTYSSDSGECVVVASDLSGIRLIRDSKNPSGPVLAVSLDQWSAFLSGVRASNPRWLL